MKTLLHLSVIAASQLCLAGFSVGAPRYVAHEWGTFTSVQGADGIQLVWNPLTVSDLPSFVHDWPKSGPAAERSFRQDLAGKRNTMTLQRMETPVIYFYAGEEMKVSARVDFPKGTMTEWYPQARLPEGKVAVNTLGPATLSWPDIEIIPSKLGSSLPVVLPQEPQGNHYYAARETEADFVRTGGETEKFLFYRGVGNFKAPLTVTQPGDNGDVIALHNEGTDELRHLFVFQMSPDGGRFLSVSSLAPGSRQEIALGKTVPFSSRSEVRQRLAEDLVRSLTQEGLYPAEAQAMVKTWDDSWFGEAGLRVFYVLPVSWTDQVLPLTLDPKPAEIARVMVGRAELITPHMEKDLLVEILRYGSGSAEEKEKAIAAARNLGLGRFMQPAISRLTARKQDKAFSNQSADFLTAVNKPVTGKRLASK